MTIGQHLNCPVCNGHCALLDVVDFNKSCEEANGTFLGLIGMPVYYVLCGQCSFCFAPELMVWEAKQFTERIYNAEYAMVDPDFAEVRPKENAATLIDIFGDKSHMFTHLDYGGGDGQLSKLLRASSWQSASYDPFMDGSPDLAQLGKFDLITAFEVFEHAPDVQVLMSNLHALLNSNGIVLFSTLLSDGNIHPKKRLDWWYASPRNGHISLFSMQSLALLAQSRGFIFGSFSPVIHAFFTGVPPWAAHIIRIS